MSYKNVRPDLQKHLRQNVVGRAIADNNNAISPVVFKGFVTYWVIEIIVLFLYFYRTFLSFSISITKQFH